MSMFFISLFLSLELSAASLNTEHGRKVAVSSPPQHPELALFALLVRPAVRPAHFSRPYAKARVPMHAVQMGMDLDIAYRTLGVVEGSGSDEIEKQFEMLSRKYEGDSAKIATLKEARDALSWNTLSSRLSKAKADTRDEQWDSLKLTKQRQAATDTVTDYRKKIFARPGRKRLTKVLTTLGGLSLLGFTAPGTAGTIKMINTAAAMGFMYNRGEREPARDSDGNIGEIIPMKKKPMTLAASIAGVAWILGLVTSHLIIKSYTLSRFYEPALRNAMVALFLLFPSLFVKVQWIDDGS